MHNDDYVNEDVTRMFNLGARVKSFQTRSVVDGKRFRWRYTVIPYQGMARLGYFYHPFHSGNEKDGIHKDAVQCICCKKVTYNFGDCRSKKKDIVETMISVLRQHLRENRCLLSELKLKVLEDHLNEFTDVRWSDHAAFGDPLSQEMIDFRQSTFIMNWEPSSESLLPKRMSQAGLVRYDSSYTGFEELMENEAQDACYCVYCKRIVGSWQQNDDPLLEHYRSCNGGHCYFFEKMRASPTHSQIILELEEKSKDIAEEQVSQELDTDRRTVENSPVSSQGHTFDTSSQEKKSSVSYELPRTTKLTSPSAEMNGNSSFNHKESWVETGDPIPSPSNNSPARKKRLLRRLSTRKYFEDQEGEVSFNSERGNSEEKEPVIEFKEHYKKTRDIGRTNKILDDSNDEFSFSAQGHSAFDIPTVASILPSNNINELNENFDERTDDSLGEQPSIPKSSGEADPNHSNERKLDSIPIDAVLSSDSSLSSTAASSPSRDKQIDHSAAELRRLRPIQRCKVN